jgi:hypothetical protein
MRCEVDNQLAVVAIVGLRFAGIARRVHAGCAAECVCANAGIISKRGQARQTRRMTCLGQRVLDEGRMRLLCLRHVEFALGMQFETDRFQHRAELLQLAGVVGGEYEFASHGI